MTAPAGAVAPPVTFGDGMCAVRPRSCGAPPRLAILSAFPGELAPLLERATIDETLVVGDRVLRVGVLAGVPVVLGLLGIGVLNAAATTNLVLDRFPIEAIVVSGVAGAPHRIGDVTVPATWMDDSCAPFATDPALLDLARAVAASPPAFEHCTPVPPEPPGDIVCLDYVPTMVVGGIGLSADPFGGNAVECSPDGDPVFRCDVEPRPAARAAEPRPAARAAPACSAGTGSFVDQGTEDMETGAVAREATRRGVPFVAFRALSDGDGDPLHLPGFPSQFFAYYRLAARNAAAAAADLVARWGATQPGSGRAAGTPEQPRPRAAPSPGVAARSSCVWPRRASVLCGTKTTPQALRHQIDRACRLLGANPADPESAKLAWCRAATILGRRAPRERLGAACADALAQTLRERGCP